MYSKKSLITIALLILATVAVGQDKKQLAQTKSIKASQLQKQGKIDEAIVLLAEANKLDPANTKYSYKLASAYNQKKSYSKAIDVLNASINNGGPNDSLYVLLSNTYGRAGKGIMALETIEQALENRPKSGALYEELGNVYTRKLDQTKALTYYEKGIEMDPNYPGNYYQAAKLYFKGPEKVWGMMYGELFMNLERTGKRNFEISKLIHDTYKKQIVIGEHDRTMNMTKEQRIKSDDPYADLMHPFGVAVYEPVLAVSMTEEDKINIYSLDRIRRKFVTLFFNGQVSKKYPNVLFEYQREIDNAGHLEAYNYWVMRKGDENGFKIWKAAYKQKWAAFEKWFPNNPIKLDDEHKLFRALYNTDGRSKKG